MNVNENIQSAENQKFKNETDKIESDGKKDQLKYFDRIHDKLFNYNNILIAGYFTLSRLDENYSIWNIIIPITNLVFIIYIDYKMMNLGRMNSKFTTLKPTEVKSISAQVYKINNYSMLTIFTTVIVTLIFLYYLSKI